MMSITEAVICWTSPQGRRSTAGTMVVLAFPGMAAASGGYESVVGARERRVHEYDEVTRRHFVLSTALGAILRDGMEPRVVHEALWKLREYREALPPDTPSPE